MFFKKNDIRGAFFKKTFIQNCFRGKIRRLFGMGMLCAAAGLFSACASAANGGAVDPRFPPTPETARKDIGDGLGEAAFQRLPPEVFRYLRAISKAFQEQDEFFLLAQGETSFMDWTRENALPASLALARLFRIGCYAEDAPGMAVQPEPRLIASETRGIVYLGWEEWGPLLEVRANIITKNQTIPARIVLVWRLDPPKIQGYVD